MQYLTFHRKSHLNQPKVTFTYTGVLSTLTDGLDQLLGIVSVTKNGCFGNIFTM